MDSSSVQTLILCGVGYSVPQGASSGVAPACFWRSAVRNLVRAGVPGRGAMTVTGHKTRSVFERCNIVSPGDLQDAAKRLEALAATTTARPALQGFVPIRKLLEIMVPTGGLEPPAS